MNWIKFKYNSKFVKKLFFKEIVPISEELHKKGIRFFPMNFNNNLSTYYIKREKRTMEPEDFEISGCDSFSGFESALTDIWKAQQHNELIPLAQISSKLAKSLYLKEEDDEEVSPFIYVMY